VTETLKERARKYVAQNEGKTFDDASQFLANFARAMLMEAAEKNREIAAAIVDAAHADPCRYVLRCAANQIAKLAE